MSAFRFVVNRPVATWMVAIACAVFGLVSYGRLALTLMPDLSYPSITVRTDVPGALPWIPMFRKIQNHDRALFIMIHVPDEIPAVLDALQPEGLALCIDAPTTPDQLDEIEKIVMGRDR